MMAEDSRGKRRKQANPKRNQVGIERVNSLGSEGEDGDEVGLWSMEPHDYQGSLDKTSLTPSEGEGDREGTEPGRSPSPRGHLTLPHSLSFSPKEGHWAEGAKEEGHGRRQTMTYWDGEREQASLTTYSQRSDSQALEDMAHCEFLVQLRKESSNHRPSQYYPQHQQLTNSSPTPQTMYLPASLNLHNDPPSIWSPAAQRSPLGQDHVSQSPDAMRNLHMCPYCQRSYHHSASLREHVKFCHKRDGEHMVYTASFREQMEQHMALHSQLHPVSEHGMESRKFKCLQCGKAFKYKHHLKEHLRIHSGEKPYECSNCKKRFSHSGSYSSHLSSKKCLTGGAGSGGGGSYNNGHGIHRASNYSPVSPSAGSGRSSNRKGSPYPLHTHDIHPLRRFERERYPGGHPDVGLLRGQELGREFSPLWDPPVELSPQDNVFKGTTLLPYLHAGGKFDQMLQLMLHKEEGGSIAIREEGGPGVHNGGRDGMASPETLKHHRAKLGEGQDQEEEGGVACRWCSQLFPSLAVLLQHERYLCKMNREAMEVPEGPCSKNHHSPLYLAPRHLLQPLPPADNHKPALTNGFPKDKSPLRRPSWHSVPQQLLVAMHSPQPRPDTLAMRSYWSRQESGGNGGSPSQLAPSSPATEMSPPPPLVRKEVHSSGFGSPLCLDLSSTSLTPPLSHARPQIRTPGSDSSQTDQPLDLSFPKPQEGKALENSTLINGNLRWGEKIQRDPAKNQSHRRLTLSPPPHQQHPAVYRGAPMFRRSIYSAYPLLNSAGLAGSRHDGVPTLPLSIPTSNHRFVSPMTFMMESDTDSVLKRIHMERQAFMSEMMARGGLDYISLMDEGADIDGGQGRKRLKKTDEGLYACDICDKTFQKSSSLLRHKYEHTGKRPHECKTCKKAFKHKHHLIEHSRLHSGEKPYQCDKCGKRFSHSGSYSQHMNHRYAYCSRDQDQEGGDELPLTPGGSTDPGHMSGGTTLSMEDTPVFLSDSSLDGGIEGRLDVEDEEEEGETKGVNGKEACSLSGSGEGLGLNPRLVIGSPAKRDRESRLEERVGELVDRHDKERKSAGLGTLGLEHNLSWEREMQKGNGDQDTDPYKVRSETSVSQ
ncbi:zinc finger E-box-binding homeobox 2-like isoform X1 [Esox lucius]|uniref:C2H2-type domain-containing protein n=2 Tax=Esox lucius TaxID=8010 RepID=A0A3P8Y1W0_ESOLU|nr:zinc finger E-box-binding homeobox 2-like isoform X1 [Esox lucius]